MGAFNAIDGDLAAFLEESSAMDRWYSAQAADLEHGKAILGRSAQQKAVIASETARELGNLKQELASVSSFTTSDTRWRRVHFLTSLLSTLIRSDLPFNGAGIEQLLKLITQTERFSGVLPIGA